MAHRYAFIVVAVLCAATMRAQDTFINPYTFTGVSFGIDATTTSTSTTFAHTCNTTNGLLTVRISTAYRTITSVTHNGDALTLFDATDNGGFLSAIYYRVSPDNGEYNIVVTLNEASSNTVITATSFNQVDQSTPLATADDWYHFTGTSIGPTGTLSASHTGEIVIDVLTWDYASASATATVGDGQTQQANQHTEYTGHAASHETGAASNTMSWTLSSSGAWALVVASINPF
jgi:hypothetical protein